MERGHARETKDHLSVAPAAGEDGYETRGATNTLIDPGAGERIELRG
jgi:hypothetical protein